MSTDYERRLIECLNEPVQLEVLYRNNPDQFLTAFNKVFAKHPDSSVLQVWHARFYYGSTPGETSAEAFSLKTEVPPVLLITLLALLASILVNIPNFLSWQYEVYSPYYARNSAFFYLPWIACYFMALNTASKWLKWTIFGALGISFAYISLLPGIEGSDSTTLAFFHVHLVLWSITGLAFLGDSFSSHSRRMDFVKLNGEMLVYTGLLYICGLLFLGLITLLFGALSFSESHKYTSWVAAAGLAAAPIVAAHLASNKGYFNKTIAPILAKIFSPLVLIVLMCFIGLSFFSTKNPYTDRDTLLIFNVVLLAVLALITFTITEREETSLKNWFTDTVNLLLSLAVLGMNLVALSAILLRLGSYGVTPNRMAVLGANVLVFINMALIFYHYVRFYTNKGSFIKVQSWIANYLPVYAVWVMIVTFLFPFLFSFK